MRECVSIHMGHAGVQLGSATWQLYCLEHNLLPNGTKNPDYTTPETGDLMSSFFDESQQSHKWVPRAVFADLEPSAINEIKNGDHKDLYNPEQFVASNHDAAGNYSRGHYTDGKDMMDNVLDKVRRLTNACNNLQGFIIYHSLGGGTGAGLTSLAMERLTVDYGRKSKIAFQVYPADEVLSQAVVEPYNALLATHATTEHTDVAFIFENQACYNICQNKLNVERPGYVHLNQFLAPVISSITTSLRFEGEVNVDLNEFQTNLVPFPRLHFPIVSFAPIVPKKKASGESPSTDQITQQCFEAGHQTVVADTSGGKYAACCMMYRGNLNSRNVDASIRNIRDKMQFVDWSPTGMKIGINNNSMATLPGSIMAPASRQLCKIANHTAMKQVFDRLAAKFDIMYKKKAFVHWFIQEGMEKGEFKEAREDIAALIKEYEGLSDGASGGFDEEGGEEEEEY